MLICPKCSFPQDDVLVSSDSEEVKCALCGFTGVRSDLLRIVSDKIDAPRVLDKLKVLMEYLHYDIAPLLAKMLVNLGFIPNDLPYDYRCALLADTTRNAVRAMYSSVVEGLLMEENDGPDSSETR